MAFQKQCRVMILEPKWERLQNRYTIAVTPLVSFMRSAASCIEHVTGGPVRDRGSLKSQSGSPKRRKRFTSGSRVADDILVFV